MKKNKKPVSKTEVAARKNVLFDSQEIVGTSVKGFDFNSIKGKMDYEKLLESYLSTGFQATHFGKALEIIAKMREEKATIYLGYTSNMFISGLRIVLKYLQTQN